MSEQLEYFVVFVCGFVTALSTRTGDILVALAQGRKIKMFFGKPGDGKKYYEERNKKKAD